MCHKVSRIALPLPGVGTVGSIFLLPRQFHGVMKMDGMDEFASDRMPQHVFIFGHRAPVPSFGMIFDGVPSSIGIQFGTGRPQLLSDFGRIFRSFGDGLHFDVTIDADTTTARFRLARLATAVKGQSAGVASAEGACKYTMRMTCQ